MTRNVFTVPLDIMVSTNKIYAGMNHFHRTQLKNDYHWMIKKVKKHIQKPHSFPVKIMYHFSFRGRVFDSSNCSFMQKMLEDALVKEGFLPDDSYQYVWFNGITIRKGPQDQVTIEIIEGEE